MSVGIVGGGMLGLTLAYLLGQRGVPTIVFEGKDRPGGLLDWIEVDGAWIDKYYHCILGSDADLLALMDDLGLHDEVRFTATKQGFFRHQRLYAMTSGKDFLLFPPLTLSERVRLGWTILAALRTNDLAMLESTSVEDWLVGLGGRGIFDKLWQPLLKAKFDGHYQHTPATYIWSRLKRTSSTKTAGQQERMGYIVGSYKVLIERLVERLAATGSHIRLGTRVQRLAMDGDRVIGVVVDGESIPLDAVVVTTPLPVLNALVPEPHRATLDLPLTSEYLGVVCGLLLLDRPLTPYYTLNIADERVPFTGLIETTNLIDPAHVGGYHLVYLPKYVTAGSPYARLSDDELRAAYLEHLAAMFPGFDAAWVRHSFVFRERFVEPLHQIGRRRPVVPVRSVLPGLFVVNNGQIYPELTNCQASVRHATRVLPEILADLADSPSRPPTSGYQRREPAIAVARDGGR